MANQLPERANLAHLRKQAKELLRQFRSGDPEAIARVQRPGGGVPRLHDVQRVLAREFGFKSWRELVEHIESNRAAGESHFVDQAWRGGHWWQSGPASPDPAVEKTAAVALMIGDSGYVKAQLKRDPSWVHQKIGPKSLEPLQYVCFSGCLQNPGLKAKLVETARILLEAGSNPNAVYEDSLSCLYGAAGCNGCSELAALLLDAGANPDDGESLYHSAEQPDSACLSLLLERGATIEGSNALARLLDYDKPNEVALLIEAGAKPNHAELHHAIARGRSPEILQMLIDAGADLEAVDKRGLLPLEVAVLAGHSAAFSLLRRYDDRELSAPFQAIYECLTGQNSSKFDGGFSESHQWAMELAASKGDARAVTRLLKLGLDVNAREPFNGGTALHGACFEGQFEVAKILLDAGAQIDLRDRTYQGLPMGWCCVGAKMGVNPTGDYLGTLTLLIERGQRFRTEADPDADCFVDGGDPAVIEFLKSKGAI